MVLNLTGVPKIYRLLRIDNYQSTYLKPEPNPVPPAPEPEPDPEPDPLPLPIPEPIITIIEGDTGWLNPTATGDDYNQWTNQTQAYTNDGLYAFASTTGHEQDYYGFGIEALIPPNAFIDGIILEIEALAGLPNGSSVLLELSGDGRANYTATGQTTGLLPTGAKVITIGNQSYNWGKAWTKSMFSDANFRVKFNLNRVSAEGFVDYVKIKVHYHTESA